MAGKKFRSIRLAKSLQYIGIYAFADCTGLTEMIIPRGVERIREGAFVGCSKLKRIIVKGRKSWSNEVPIVDDLRKVDIQIEAQKNREKVLTYRPFADIQGLLKDYIEERALNIANYIIDNNATVR